jgi:signal transduction histidine kinase
LIRSTRLRQRAEEAEAGVSLLLRHLPDALLMIDDGDRVVFANEAAKAALGSDALGRPIRELLPGLVHPPDPHLAVAADIRVGSKIFSPIVGDVSHDGRMRTAIALRDVTAERSTEARRLDFYSIVAHDLRTPISAVLLRAERMLRGRVGELSTQSRAEIEMIRARLRQMGDLLNDFLDLARVDASGMGIEPTEMDLNAIVVEAVEHLRGVADDVGLKLDCECCAEPQTMQGDPRRLRQVVTNLVSNAIKFTPAGGSVVVTMMPGAKELTVSVRDTGVGIAPTALPILFQRYARAVDARSIVGTGLGLMIVRDVVEAHGGKVGVESEPGAGSRFWFSLPRVRPAA